MHDTFDDTSGALRHTTRVWLLLMSVTIVTTWVLSKDALSTQLATVCTLALADWKVELVLLDFMELRHAPRLQRAPFLAWAVLVPLGIVVMYAVA